MDVDSLGSFLQRQQKLAEGFVYIDTEQQKKCIKELREDRKRLKGKDSEQVAQIAHKHLRSKPRIAELKRMLSDCLFKLLSYFVHGMDALWYDRKCGAGLMQRMWNEFGSRYARPSYAQLQSYLKEFEMIQDPRKTVAGPWKPRLVDEVAFVVQHLHQVCNPDTYSQPFLDADRALNDTVDQIWKTWQRDRQELAAPHVDSYNYFLEEGMQACMKDIVDQGEGCHAWNTAADSAHIFAHVLPESIQVRQPKITPQQARTRCTSYSGKVTCCVQVTVFKAGHRQPLHLAECMAYETQDKIMKMNNWLEQNEFVPKGSAKAATELLWKDAEFPLVLGDVPIMVGSTHCRMHGLSPEQKVAIDEDEDEFGGYFIANGNECIVRLMVNSRSNYPIALERRSFAERGDMISPKAVVVRSTLPNGLSIPNSLLHEKTGVAHFSFQRGQQFLIPAAQVLMALKPISFYEFYQLFLPPERLESSQLDAEACRQRAANNVQMVWDVLKKSGQTSDTFDWVEFLGNSLKSNRVAVRWLPNPAYHSTRYIGEYVLRRHVLPHLNDSSPLSATGHREEKERKFQLLVHMVHKLFNYEDGLVGPDVADQTSNQQIVTPGDTMAVLCHQNFLKFNRELEGRIKKYSKLLESDMTTGAATLKMWDLLRTYNTNVFDKCEFLLKTGNFSANNNRVFGVMQNSGLSIKAERINAYRIMSQIRSIHRGSVVQEMRSSVARKLPLEAWGFICPVETPDGAPCGVLNHLTYPCLVTAALRAKGCAQVRGNVLQALVYRNMRPVDVCPFQESRTLATVTLDGEVLGYIDRRQLQDRDDDNIGTWLRSLKDKQCAAHLGLPALPQCLEICCIPFPGATADPDALGVYPGLVLFTTPGRLMRPVKSLVTGAVEHIGTLEQVYLHIACTGKDIVDLPRERDLKLFRHIEISPVATLSFVSSMIPFFGHNPSPRNLFQCQMAKQTMGIANISSKQRFDNKAYDLRQPQRPLVVTEQHWGWGMDSHPITTNTIVAIISYAEYDMEDAVVINKSSVERGMFAADVTKTWTLDLNFDLKKTGTGATWNPNTASVYRCFRKRTLNAEEKPRAVDNVDDCGLPKKGAELKDGTVYFECCEVHHTLDVDSMAVDEDRDPGLDPVSKLPRVAPCCKDYVNHKPGRYTKSERCFVEDVQPIEVTEDGDVLAAVVRVRIIRNPVIGDKFSSRHGQKGTLSMLMPATDMPFSDSGMTPDLMINPHAFPSRMTVGMMMELVAGKLAAMTGRFIAHESSAWNAECTSTNAHELLGEQLARLGFDFYGEETLYSGQTGEQLFARIFIGCCAYQRLRHMVMDKWQVREKTGPVDLTTLQPLKGRKRGGGIKVGEMERDALLSHGCMNLLMDRLFSHGLTQVPVCSVCGAFITMKRKAISVGAGWLEDKEADDAVAHESISCSQCESDEYRMVGLPFAFVYLSVELLSLNIEVCLKLRADT